MLKLHVKQTLGITISKDTAHRLVQPPRQNTVSSKQFNGFTYIPLAYSAKIAMKKVHEVFYYTLREFNLVNEKTYLCGESTVALSVDNKNQVKLEIPATSHLSTRTFYLIEESSNYNEHDFFMYANSKQIVPKGGKKYFFMISKTSFNTDVSKVHRLKKKKKQILQNLYPF